MRVTPLPLDDSTNASFDAATQHSGRIGGKAPPDAVPTAVAAAVATAAVAGQQPPVPAAYTVGESQQHQAALDPNMFELGRELPSTMCFYPFDNLGVRHFGILEHVKLRRSVTEESLRHQVDAVSACQDHSAYDLTVGDFQFLMYWHRINDFKRTPYTVEWTCNDADHERRTVAAYATEYARAQERNQGLDSLLLPPLEPDSLINVHVLQRSNMEVVRLNTEACEEFMIEFEDNYGFKLFPPMIRDAVFALEEDDIPADLSAYNRYAGLLNPHCHGESLAQRRHALLLYTQQHPGLDIVTDFEHWVKISDHGVREAVDVVCKGCGSKRSLVLRVDPFTFFPAV